jgi:hypothetical protein
VPGINLRETYSFTGSNTSSAFYVKFYPKLAQPVYVRDLALGSTCVSTMEVVLIYNTGLFYFRRGNLKKAETVLNLAYSRIDSYNKNIVLHEQFLVQVTIVTLDLLAKVKICRASHA